MGGLARLKEGGCGGHVCVLAGRLTAREEGKDAFEEMRAEMRECRFSLIYISTLHGAGRQESCGSPSGTGGLGGRAGLGGDTSKHLPATVSPGRHVVTSTFTISGVYVCVCVCMYDVRM